MSATKIEVVQDGIKYAFKPTLAADGTGLTGFAISLKSESKEAKDAQLAAIKTTHDNAKAALVETRNAIRPELNLTDNEKVDSNGMHDGGFAYDLLALGPDLKEKAITFAEAKQLLEALNGKLPDELLVGAMTAIGNLEKQAQEKSTPAADAETKTALPVTYDIKPLIKDDVVEGVQVTLRDASGRALNAEEQAHFKAQAKALEEVARGFVAKDKDGIASINVHGNNEDKEGHAQMHEHVDIALNEKDDIKCSIELLDYLQEKANIPKDAIAAGKEALEKFRYKEVEKAEKKKFADGIPQAGNNIQKILANGGVATKPETIVSKKEVEAGNMGLSA